MRHARTYTTWSSVTPRARARGPPTTTNERTTEVTVERRQPPTIPTTMGNGRVVERFVLCAAGAPTGRHQRALWGRQANYSCAAVKRETFFLNFFSNKLTF